MIFEKKQKLTDRWQEISEKDLKIILSNTAYNLIMKIRGQIYNCEAGLYLRKKPQCSKKCGAFIAEDEAGYCVKKEKEADRAGRPSLSHSRVNIGDYCDME